MSKFKLCPVCQAQNDPRSMECASCGTDLMGVPIIDSEAIPVQPEPTVGTESSDASMVRICYCGEINPPQARKCKSCGEDISDILPIPREVPIDAHYQLATVDGSFVYQVPCGSIVIGREHGMRECLSEKSFVSRVHAKLTVEDGILFIENLSSTNYTYVNNRRIGHGKVQLHEGDEIGLGGICINGNRQDEAAYLVVGIMP